jgi:hypothetical protein
MRSSLFNNDLKSDLLGCSMSFADASSDAQLAKNTTVRIFKAWEWNKARTHLTELIL